MPTPPQQEPDRRPRDPVVVLLERILVKLEWILMILVLGALYVLAEHYSRR